MADVKECHICHVSRDKPGRWYCSAAHPLPEPLSREEILEDALHRAISTIEFLHDCLTNPVFKYAYPEHTTEDLKKFKKLVPKRKWCLHSRYHADCDACEEHRIHYLRKELTDEQTSNSTNQS